MSIYVNNSGTWTVSKEVYVNNGGAWSEPQEIYVNNGGTWTLVHKVVNITSNIANLNLYNYVGSPSNALTLKVVIGSGVTIYSTDPGSPSLVISGFNSASNITIINNGSIIGAGGAGGTGTNYGAGPSTAQAGSGGTAIYTHNYITIQNNGLVAGGGGGGAGGGYYSSSSSCFTGDTLVSTPDGLVKIKDLEVGDIVYAYDASGSNYTSPLFEKRVTETFVHSWEESGEVSPLLVITHGQGKLTTTVNHHIMTSSRVSDTDEADEGFVQADELKVGDTIYLEGGVPTTILNIEAGPQYDFVYNITVEDFHTFVADGIRVHNKGGGKGTTYYYYGGGGGGGGAGVVGGIGGVGGTGSNGNGYNGSNGSQSVGGAGGVAGDGGSVSGGAGGALGQNGSGGFGTNYTNAGGAGWALLGSSYVTWSVMGTILGSPYG